MKHHLQLLTALFLLSATAVGCASSPPARLYLLNSPSPESVKLVPKGIPAYVNLQVQVPEYLDRPQIMIREAEHRLCLAELDRWAEPLSRMITRVLSQELASASVQINAPGPSEENAQIWVQILQLDGMPGGEVHLQANWQIASPRAGQGKVRFFSAAAPVSGETIDDLVRTHEQLLSQLATEISQAVNRELSRQ